MRYMPLVFLGYPFGIVGVFVMLGVSTVAIFALPAYGKRVTARTPDALLGEMYD
jgi:hypothetical protein